MNSAASSAPANAIPFSPAEHAQLKDYANLEQLPHAWERPLGSGDLRTIPADFRVIESLSFKPSGAGEHLLVRVRKTENNTRWVAKQLAQITNIPYRSVSYAGLKDRHAVAEQWFGLHLAQRSDPIFTGKLPAGVEVLECLRHNRKLRQGQLRANQFVIRIRNCEKLEEAEIDRRVTRIACLGVPNYFGAQRFGHGAGNLALVTTVDEFESANRETRSFALSALRAALFNGYLAQRVRSGTWIKPLPGEITMSAKPRGVGDDNQPRFPTGVLWGKSKALLSVDEESFYSSFQNVTGLLEAIGAKAMRRVLCVIPEQVKWRFDSDDLLVDFMLPPGAFATVVLREILNLRESATTFNNSVTN